MSNKRVFQSGDKLEIGNVYKNCRGQYFVAVDNHKIMTAIEGKIVVKGNTYKLHPDRDISVDALCQIWNISLQQLDAITRECMGYMPDRTKGSRKRECQYKMAQEWRRFRTVAILKT